MYITLKAYLGRISAEERSRIGQRRHVPSMDELATLVGIHPVTMSNLVNGKVKLLNLDLGGRIITELRKLGFDTAVDDVIAYRPPDKEGEEK